MNKSNELLVLFCVAEASGDLTNHATRHYPLESHATSKSVLSATVSSLLRTGTSTNCVRAAERAADPDSATSARDLARMNGS